MNGGIELTKKAILLAKEYISLLKGFTNLQKYIINRLNHGNGDILLIEFTTKFAELKTYHEIGVEVIKINDLGLIKYVDPFTISNNLITAIDFKNISLSEKGKLCIDLINTSF